MSGNRVLGEISPHDLLRHHHSLTLQAGPLVLILVVKCDFPLWFDRHLFSVKAQAVADAYSKSLSSNRRRKLGGGWVRCDPLRVVETEMEPQHPVDPQPPARSITRDCATPRELSVGELVRHGSLTRHDDLANPYRGLTPSGRGHRATRSVYHCFSLQPAVTAS